MEIGFGNCDETVSSCVLVQKTASPKFVICVPAACRSKLRMSTLAIASTISVAPNANSSLDRR